MSKKCKVNFNKFVLFLLYLLLLSFLLCMFCGDDGFHLLACLLCYRKFLGEMKGNRFIEFAVSAMILRFHRLQFLPTGRFSMWTWFSVDMVIRWLRQVIRVCCWFEFRLMEVDLVFVETNMKQITWLSFWQILNENGYFSRLHLACFQLGWWE